MLILEKNIKFALEDGALPKYKARNILARQLSKDGKSTKEIAEILGVNVRTVQRHLKMMPDIHDQARRLPGNKYKLSQDQLNSITNAISAPPTKSGFLVSEWTTHVLQQYIWDEFEITVSREKARQLLQSNCSTAKQISSNAELKKKIRKWKQNNDTAIWIIGHLYLGTQNRQVKFKSGKKPFIDDDLLMTPEEIEQEKIDLSKKATPQITLCAINLKTNDLRCIFLNPNDDEKKQINRLFVRAANLSRKKQVIFLTTRSSIIGKNLETRRYSLLNKSIFLEYLPASSFIFEPLRSFRRAILTKFSLLDHKESNGIKEKSSKAKEFGKTTYDVLSKYFKEKSTF